MGGGAAAALAGLPVVGDVIAGKYTIERVLAVGGMGAVMAAHDAALDRRVAIKFMLPKALESPEVRERFFREARAVVAIRSEHVVDVYEVGVAAPDIPYIVMEYLPGRDLHQLLDGRAPLPVHEAVDFVLQSCEALAEAHSLGIIHRDVKPSNLFVTHRPDGSPFVKVLDFGISKTIARLEEQAKSLTQSSVSLGSPLYMSPEQVRNSKVVDSRTDIWSLGVVLYELLAKQLPFDGETVPSLAAAIVGDAPRGLRETRPDVSPRLEAVILKCLEKDPAKRFQKIGAFAHALAEFSEPGSQRPLQFERIEQSGRVSALAFQSTTEGRSPLSERETTAEPGSTNGPTVGAATTAGLGTTQRHHVRQRRSLGIMLGVGAILGMGAFAFLRHGPEPSLRNDSVTPPSIAPASAESVGMVGASADAGRIVDIDRPLTATAAAPLAPPPSTAQSAHVVTTPTPKATLGTGLGSPSGKRPAFVPKAPPPSVPAKPPAPKPAESGGLPSALGGSR